MKTNSTEKFPKYLKSLINAGRISIDDLSDEEKIKFYNLSIEHDFSLILTSASDWYDDKRFDKMLKYIYEIIIVMKGKHCL
ncbi:MAG: hypothetical protein AABY15_07020 [Nanoarchaeota archaeon]